MSAKDDRLDGVFEELELSTWQFTFVTETWGPEKSEKWIHEAYGHTFIGAGGSVNERGEPTGRRGVGITSMRTWHDL